jgi:hypothetical protein
MAFLFTPGCLEPPFDDPADNLVVVGPYPNLVEAGFVSRCLESHDIMACIPEVLAPQNLGLSAVAEYTVRVAARHFEAARKIIAELSR